MRANEIIKSNEAARKFTPTLWIYIHTHALHLLTHTFVTHLLRAETQGKKEKLLLEYFFSRRAPFTSLCILGWALDTALA